MGFDFFWGGDVGAGRCRSGEMWERGKDVHGSGGQMWEREREMWEREGQAPNEKYVLEST